MRASAGLSKARGSIEEAEAVARHFLGTLADAIAHAAQGRFSLGDAENEATVMSCPWSHRRPRPLTPRLPPCSPRRKPPANRTAGSSSIAVSGPCAKRPLCWYRRSYLRPDRSWSFRASKRYCNHPYAPFGFDVRQGRTAPACRRISRALLRGLGAQPGPDRLVGFGRPGHHSLRLCGQGCDRAYHLPQNDHRVPRVHARRGAVQVRCRQHHSVGYPR